MIFRKIMVLGCNSFTGSNFVNFCLEKNKKVLGISRSNSNEKYMLKYAGNKRKLTNFNYINADINKDLKKILSSIKSDEPIFTTIVFEFLIYIF